MKCQSLTIANKLRYYRKKCGMTQEQVASQLHIDRSNYVYYETGKLIPPLKKIVKFAKLFNISYTDLLDDYCEELSKECEDK